MRSLVCTSAASLRFGTERIGAQFLAPATADRCDFIGPAIGTRGRFAIGSDARSSRLASPRARPCAYRRGGRRRCSRQSLGRTQTHGATEERRNGRRANRAVRGTLFTVDDSTPREIPRETLIVEALSEVFRMLDDGERTAASRELRTQARFFDRAVKHWVVVPPTLAQVDAMFDLVVDLHERAVSVRRARSSA